MQMPRFQNRALGTPVYYEDEIVFESVKHEGLQLNVSYGPDFVYPSAWKHAKHPGSDVLPEIAFARQAVAAALDPSAGSACSGVALDGQRSQ